MDEIGNPFNREYELPIMSVGYIPAHYTQIQMERQVLNELKQLKKKWLKEDPELKNIDPKYVLKNGLTLEQFGLIFILQHHTKRYQQKSIDDESSHV